MLKKFLLGLVAILFGVWLVTFLALRFETHEYAKISNQQQAEAKAYLEGKLTPIPDGWQWSVFSPQPDVNLRSGFIDAGNAKGTVIVVPGFTGSIEMVMREITQLNAAGFRVASIEYRGQGESWRPLSHPEKGYVESYTALGADIAEFAKRMKIADKPLFFFSISKGAHITMRMAAEQDLDVSAYALIVPMVKINTGEIDYAVVHRLSAVFTGLGLGSMYAPGQSAWPNDGELEFGVATDCNGNPDTAQSQSAMFALRESLRTRGTTMRWVYETMTSTELLLTPEYVASIDAPVKIFTAGIDTLVISDASHQFCESLLSCQITHYEQARHCIARENFTLYDSIIDQSIVHFNSHLSQ